MVPRLTKWMCLPVVALGIVWGVCFMCAPYDPQAVKIQDACYPALVAWQMWGQFGAGERS